MIHPLPAAIALFAFGALFAGSALLLLISPGRRGIRWWVVLQGTIMVWLLLQGWRYLGGDWWLIQPGIRASVFLLPVVFIAFALMEATERPTWLAFLVIGAGVLVLRLETAMRPESFGLLTAFWHTLGWSIGSVILFGHHMRREKPRRVDPERRRTTLIVVGLLLLMTPISLIGGFVLGSRMWAYAMPLLVVWIQLLVFFGVARLRFYDIEVRARRTGALAAEAAEQERLAVVGELSASLAHEIRNPLTGVRSLAQRLAEETIDEERRRRYAGVILEEVGRVERLVVSLLGLAKRPEPGAAPRVVPLAELFDDLVLLVSSRADASSVRVVAEPARTTLRARREPLAQALLNLLLNAIAHSPAGGEVRLTAARRGEAVELSVSDAGPGVPEGERERVWEPFHSGSGGTGLGLAVVRRLARENGWEARLENAPGGGTRAVLSIPRAAVGEPTEIGGAV